MGDEVEFRLVGDISSDDPSALRTVIEDVITGTVTQTRSGFHVEVVACGRRARDVNRVLLSALRRVERRTRLRAEWTLGGVSERFFDYVPKGDIDPTRGLTHSSSAHLGPDASVIGAASCISRTSSPDATIDGRMPLVGRGHPCSVQPSDHRFWRAAYGGNSRAQRLRNLHRESADTPEAPSIKTRLPMVERCPFREASWPAGRPAKHREEQTLRQPPSFGRTCEHECGEAR